MAVRGTARHSISARIGPRRRDDGPRRKTYAIAEILYPSAEVARDVVISSAGDRRPSTGAEQNEQCVPPARAELPEVLALSTVRRRAYSRISPTEYNRRS